MPTVLRRGGAEPGASGDSSLGGVMFPSRQSWGIFLGTSLPASGRAALSKEEWEGLVLSPSLLESFLPGPKAAG